MLSPVFKALKEHEESHSGSSPNQHDKINHRAKSSSEDVTISPHKCHLRPVRNLNKEFVNSPSKRSNGQDAAERNSSEESSVSSVDVYAAFGQYVAAEMRCLNEKQVRALKEKIMRAILESKPEQKAEV